jgi:ketose-bisphosphate aldolase
MLVSPLELYKKAKKGGYAIGAFNTSTLEITRAIIETAEKLKSPVIIETSPGEAGFLTPEMAAAEVKTLAQKAKVPVVLHLDHGNSLELVKEVIKAGYTSVHIDGSSLSVAENTKLTKEAVVAAHKKKITVEGEIGHVAGSSEKHETKLKIAADSLTDPAEAATFARKTGVDVLAVSIGNIHGVYDNPPKLDIERLVEIEKKVKKFFSLHGGSGIPKNQIKKAIACGVVKVNVNTELRLAYHDGLLHEFEVNPDEVVPYKYLPAGAEAVKKVVEAKIRLFGSVNKA